MKYSKTLTFLANFILITASLLAIAPLVLLIVASFTDNTWAVANGFHFFPGKWSMDAYKYIANKWEMIGRAYFMTFVVTIVGTALGLFISATYAYGLSKKDLPFRRFLSFLLIFTMLFNGGLVTSYYCYVNIFHVRDTIWALIMPNLLMGAFKVILLRNYFQNSIPDSLIDAARIDGADEFKIFGKVVVPLSMPIMATVGMMTAIGYWNDWQNGLYYLTQRDGAKLYTIQTVLNIINENIQFLAGNSGDLIIVDIEFPSTSARMAIAVLGVIPIMAAYPFFQKFFVKGITLGGVKE